MEADPAHCPQSRPLLAAHGVTSYLPTTVTAPLEKTLEALERLADAIDNSASDEQRIALGRSESTLRARSSATLAGEFIRHDNLSAADARDLRRLWRLRADIFAL